MIEVIVMPAPAPAIKLFCNDGVILLICAVSPTPRIVPSKVKLALVVVVSVPEL